MILKLTDGFLNQYHMKEISEYNDNYYELPFKLKYEGKEYDILRIRFDGFSNTNNYSLCCLEDEIGEIEDDIYIIDSNGNEEDYELDLTKVNRRGWY